MVWEDGTVFQSIVSGPKKRGNAITESAHASGEIVFDYDQSVAILLSWYGNKTKRDKSSQHDRKPLKCKRKLTNKTDSMTSTTAA
mmetsp:Transcript_299/g.606  ORF Transcript_299/g.606 Transcript_299/m.606 type:complete len:85 (-) Transcript_299:76-330(-)